MDERYLNLFKDFVLDFHGMISWAKKKASIGMKLKLFPILTLFLIIIPGVVFAGNIKWSGFLTAIHLLLVDDEYSFVEIMKQKSSKYG